MATETQQELQTKVEPQKEHRWLRKLLGCSHRAQWE